MSTDNPEIELDLAEQHVLTDLIDGFIHERVWEAARAARDAERLEEAAARMFRLAQLKMLAEDGHVFIAPRELGAHRADLMMWLLEAEDITDEHIANAVDDARSTILQDYAHRCLCERIVKQIDAQAAVTA